MGAGTQPRGRHGPAGAAPAQAGPPASDDAVPLIYNPVAGGGRGHLRFRQAEALFALRGIAVQAIPTQRPGGATQLADDLCRDGHRLLYVMGGDGTLSEASEGVLRGGHRPVLGFIPSGTGNDFLRDFGSTDTAHAIDRITMGRARAIDAAVARFDQGGRPCVRHWINVFGTGFAAQAAELANRRMKWVGRHAYNLAVVVRLLRLGAYPTRLVLDGQEHTGDHPLVMVCNSIHTGGAMQMAPMARTDDGLLDVLTVDAVSRRELFRLLLQVHDGSHIRHRKVHFHRVRSIRIEPEVPLPLLVDGEVLGDTPVEIDVLPGALQVLL